ncbi:MAG: bifunctional oligoribonuclease/PAP phosphatase NrnA [Spirochaetaceae bacterium]|jgi:phosphoesterase RecJ-like protein|nr:bifunctional oligoribonuclease/PAP phosphatase NrnA [Spirochaetaceae bacterium]
MPVPVPPELPEFIKTGNTFLVAGHKEPDGDCIGSQLALCSALERLGKRAIPCSAGPFKRPEIRSFENRFISRPEDSDREGGRVILVDCSEPERTGDLKPFLLGLPVAIVDHHALGNRGGWDTQPVLYLDTTAPSVTVMILNLVEALGLRLTGEEAEFLLLGLCTDTGFFRHVDARGALTFTYAARLVEAGANPKEIFKIINGGKSLGSRLLLGRVLSRAEAYYEGKLILSTETYEETQSFGKEGRDSDSLYQLLQSVAGVEAIVIIRQESPEKCSIGLRSRDWVNVAEVALGFGGGGHKNAAGFSYQGLIGELRPAVVEAFKDQLVH